MPGIMQGHTDHYAFGRTNSHIDQEDLYVLELSGRSRMLSPSGPVEAVRKGDRNDPSEGRR
jgi:hypothetical protein